jgi:hypothetical protein
MTSKNIKIVMVLDESGSMEVNKKEIIQTVNKFIKSQQEEKIESECLFTLITFNDQIRTVVNNKQIGKISPIKDSEYNPSTCTALYDAMGYAINKFSNDKNVVLVVVTDGEENSSKEFNQKMIKELLDIRVKPDTYDWSVIYLCADPTLIKQGEKIGINNNTSGYNNVSQGFDDLSNFSGNLSRAVSNYRRGTTNVVKLN